MSEFIQVRAGTIDPIDFQCVLNEEPAPLGSPTLIELTRIRMDTKTTLSNVTLTVQDAALGKVRWTPTPGQIVLSAQGYEVTVVVTGGTNPGTYPTHGYAYVGVI